MRYPNVCCCPSVENAKGSGLHEKQRNNFFRRECYLLEAYWADHLTLEGVGWGVISGQQFFFSSILVGRIFFSLLNALQDIFFSPHFSAGFLFKKSVVFTFSECIYIYIVVIAEIVLTWSCKAVKCCKLYKIILVYGYMFSECHSLESFHITY